jgi:hypothetical protein
MGTTIFIKRAPARRLVASRRNGQAVGPEVDDQGACAEDRSQRAPHHMGPIGRRIVRCVLLARFEFTPNRLGNDLSRDRQVASVSARFLA